MPTAFPPTFGERHDTFFFMPLVFFLGKIAPGAREALLESNELTTLGEEKKKMVVACFCWRGGSALLYKARGGPAAPSVDRKELLDTLNPSS